MSCNTETQNLETMTKIIKLIPKKGVIKALQNQEGYVRETYSQKNVQLYIEIKKDLHEIDALIKNHYLDQKIKLIEYQYLNS